MDEAKFLGPLYVLIGCVLVCFYTIEVQYLEESGLPWIQVFVYSELSNFISACVFGFFYQLWHYHGASTSDPKQFLSYLFSLFPSKSMDNNNNTHYQQWKVLIGRGISLGFATEFYMISLVYLSSGDAALIRTMVPQFGLLLIAIIFFDEKLSFAVCISFIFAVIGLLLVCQPSFVFNTINTQTISLIGLLFISVSSIAQICNKSFVKYSGNINVNWVAMMIIGFLISSIIALVNLLVVFVVYYYYIENELNVSKDIWINLNTLGTDVKIALSFLTITLVSVKCFMIIGFQIGDLSRVSIVSNIDVPLTYLAQDLLLNENSNYITYIGVVVTIVSVIIIFWDKQYQNMNSNNNNIGNTIDNISSMSYMSDNISYSDKSSNGYSSIVNNYIKSDNWFNNPINHSTKKVDEQTALISSPIKDISNESIGRNNYRQITV